ncbi:unnamed protein product [Discula destructiva]
MEPAGKSAKQLRAQIAQAEKELQALREQLAALEPTAQNEDEKSKRTEGTPTPPPAAIAERFSPERRKTGAPGQGLQRFESAVWKWPLREEEYQRYGRQLILPQVGINGQQRLKAARVLIVGAGGLGCPAAAYLAGAGVGTLGVVDGDVVEASNLHRQIGHSTARVGMLKVDSLAAYCRELNPLTTFVTHPEHLTPTNAEEIVKAYDLVLDCTDHPTSRYLISDICVLLHKPLVSASALRTDGQLIVLNTPPTPQGSSTPTAPPCYRCVFPKPPPPEAVVSCGEGGILGPVVGVMGVLQALEALKILAAGRHVPRTTFSSSSSSSSCPSSSSSSSSPSSSSSSPETDDPQPTLLLFSAGAGAPTFRTVKMRRRRQDCFACGATGGAANLTLDTLRSGSLDYLAFCGGMSAPIKVLDKTQRISANDVRERLDDDAGNNNNNNNNKKPPFLLLDVREKELFDIAHIDGAVNVPYSRIQSSAARRSAAEKEKTAVDGGGGGLPEWMPEGLLLGEETEVVVVCRVGNDSQMVARLLLDLGLGRDGERWIGDIEGGMRDWRNWVDPTLPFL